MEKSTTYFKYMRPERLGDVFEKHKIRFTQPRELNDPLEFNPILKGYGDDQYIPYNVDGILMFSDAAWDREHLVERRINEFGILSLTADPSSYDMWSRYANGHTGFLIELAPDFSSHQAFQVGEEPFPNVREIEYVDRYEIDIHSICDETGFVSSDKFAEEAFFKKTPHWQKENEYRLIKKIVNLERDDAHPDIYLNCLPLTSIVSVTFGALMSQEEKREIIKRCEGAGIQFFQAIIYRDRPKSPMDLWPVSGNQKLLSNILRWKPRLFVMEKEREEAFFKRIQLQKISELPYYNNYKETVEMLYKRKKERKKERDSEGGESSTK